MIHFSRLGTLTLIAGGALSTPFLYGARAEMGASFHAPALLLSHSSQGYLGVVLNDVNSDRAATLKLKDSHGAEIIKIDQDAPAGKAGLRIHDVVVQMNGQRVENVEQLRRMLRETPPGRTVSLNAIRDGQSVDLSVQLADRKTISTLPVELPSPDLAETAPVETWTLPGSGSKQLPGHSSFLGSLMRDRYYVGLQLQPLTTQLADYFGVKDRSGLLVGAVSANSPASAAGLKAADVIQRVNGRAVVSLSDWQRAMRANRGKQVQVTVIRDKKEQTLTLIAGETKTTSQLAIPGADSASLRNDESLHDYLYQ